MSKPRDSFGLKLLGAILLTGVLITAIIMIGTGDSIHISAYSPKENLSAYHLIKDDDIVNTRIFSLFPHEGVALDQSQIVDKYTIVPIATDQVIKNSMLVDVPDVFDRNNMVVINFVANSGTIFDGCLQSGDLVDIILLPKDNSSAPVSFNGTMLLDIKENSGENAQKTYIFVVALDRSEKERFFNCSRDSDIRIVKVFNENESI